jgi:hypothetical protein
MNNNDKPQIPQNFTTESLQRFYDDRPKQNPTRDERINGSFSSFILRSLGVKNNKRE